MRMSKRQGEIGERGESGSIILQLRHPWRAIFLLIALLAMEGMTVAGFPFPFKHKKKETAEGKSVEGKKEDVVDKNEVSVVAAFLLLSPHLPPGTEKTSGFRTGADQLAIIRHDAGRVGIPVPDKMRVDKPETWRGVLLELRRRGYEIADPDKTSHSSEDVIVFDLAHGNLDEIIKGCRTTERLGLIKIRKIIKEGVNQAVHVELDVTQKGLLTMGSTPPANVPAPNGNDPERDDNLRRLY